MAVDTLGHLLALRVSPANEDDRAHVGEVVQAVQELTGEKVEVAYVDQGYTGSITTPLTSPVSQRSTVRAVEVAGRQQEPLQGTAHRR
jgi:hypothetical protein